MVAIANTCTLTSRSAFEGWECRSSWRSVEAGAARARNELVWRKLEHVACCVGAGRANNRADQLIKCGAGNSHGELHTTDSSVYRISRSAFGGGSAGVQHHGVCIGARDGTTHAVMLYGGAGRV